MKKLKEIFCSKKVVNPGNVEIKKDDKPPPTKVWNRLRAQVKKHATNKGFGYYKLSQTL